MVLYPFCLCEWCHGGILRNNACIYRGEGLYFKKNRE